MRRIFRDTLWKWRDLIDQLGSPLGRMEFLIQQYSRLRPILFLTARLYRRYFLKRTRIIAVVGSFGKSTTARSVSAALGGDEKKISQRNSGSFVARALLHARPWQRHAVIEVGIGETGSMARYAHLLQPDITVVTCIGSEHNRSLKTLETTRHEKAEMVRVLTESGLAVLNGDDPNVRWMAGQTRAKILYFGFDETNDLRASCFKLAWPNGSRFTLHSGMNTYDVQISLFGRHMVHPILAAAAVAFHEGFSAEKTLARLKSLPPTSGRMQTIALPNGAFILRDDHKSALETIETSLDVLAEIPGRRILVMGAVSEPPGRQGPIYNELSKRISTSASCVILVNRKSTNNLYRSGLNQADYPSESVVRIRQRQKGRGSTKKVVEILRKDLKAGDVVLIKGRDSQRFERIAFELMGQPVRCDIDYCGVTVFNCEHCPRLKQG